MSTTQENSHVYLDYAASVPLRDVARNSLRDFYDQPWAGANPLSLHTYGRKISEALETARRQILLPTEGAFKPTEAYFTGGATEAINLALLGMAEGMRRENPTRNVLYLSALEHDAVSELTSPLERRGFVVNTIPASGDGLLDLSFLENRIDNTCALVAVMGANNETGVVQDIAGVADIAHRAGARLFVDAVQAFCKTSLPYEAIDALAFAGHKLGAPQGTGAMLIKRNAAYVNQMFGGGQEKGRRPGTQNTAGNVALGDTVAYLYETTDRRTAELVDKTNYLEARIFTPESGIHSTLYADSTCTNAPIRVPGIVSAYVKATDSETLLLALDARGFYVSAASACTQGVAHGSKVLRAMGFSNAEASSSLRISFDERVSKVELAAFSEALLDVVQKSLS